MWRGALPHPADFRGYEDVLPGSADRILSMAENSVRVRDEALERESTAEVEQGGQGLALAFVLTAAAFVAAIVFFAFGRQVAGCAFLSFPVLMLIRSFITRSSD